MRRFKIIIMHTSGNTFDRNMLYICYSAYFFILTLNFPFLDEDYVYIRDICFLYDAYISSSIPKSFLFVPHLQKFVRVLVSVRRYDVLVIIFRILFLIKVKVLAMKRFYLGLLRY